MIQRQRNLCKNLRTYSNHETQYSYRNIPLCGCGWVYCRSIFESIMLNNLHELGRTYEIKAHLYPLTTWNNIEICVINVMFIQT